MSDQPQTPVVRPALRIQPVDPIAFVGEASAILKSAWQAPCLDYSTDYLRFQCSFPTTLEPIALAAFEEQEPVGFVAGVGRSANIGELYLASFLGVRPGTTSMVAVGLQRQHLRTITQQLAKPLLAFTYLKSVGDHLLQSCNLAGVKRIALGEYRIHAAIPRETASDVRISEVPPEEWAAAAEKLTSELLLSPQFDPATVHHFNNDPGGRQFLMALDGNTVIGVAMRALTRTVTATGIENVPTLHYVRVLDGRADGLKALVAFAGGAAKSIVTVPNTLAIGPAMAKTAGLFPTRTAFAAYLLSAHDVPVFRGTEFEIV